MSETARVVRIYEGGTLTLWFAGVGFELSIKLFQQVLALFINEIEESVKIVAA